MTKPYGNRPTHINGKKMDYEKEAWDQLLTLPKKVEEVAEQVSCDTITVAPDVRALAEDDERTMKKVKPDSFGKFHFCLCQKDVSLKAVLIIMHLRNAWNTFGQRKRFYTCEKTLRSWYKLKNNTSYEELLQEIESLGFITRYKINADNTLILRQDAGEKVKNKKTWFEWHEDAYQKFLHS